MVIDIKRRSKDNMLQHNKEMRHYGKKRTIAAWVKILNLQRQAIKCTFLWNCQKNTGCPPKKRPLVFLAKTPLWKGLGTKVGCVLKYSGYSLSDKKNIFQFDPLEAEKIRSKEIHLPEFKFYWL